ncbi:carbamate kinase [Pseudonocardia ailaonensis]|uniref:Carbamate kinase n=1 Tax=Pseudonocardia ailaonensis TaxID=367279 RepID=A0ABN2MVW8_9PSEU
MPRTAVVALGGNAITRQGQAGTAAEQEENADRLAAGVADLRAAGWRVVVVHGNGPQVGNLAIQQQEAAERVPALPLATLVAMTEGALGSLIDLALLRADPDVGVVSVVTHVVVDGADPAFSNPTKPVGPFMTLDEATHVADELGWTVGEDAGRGYRRLVPSPAPQKIVELAAISGLVEQGAVVVAAGGGGVPVLAEGASYRPVDAVIDKDLAAQRLAAALHADALVLVTDISRVQLDFGTDTAREVAEMTVEEARGHQADGQFPEGSMGPKIRAAIGFLEEGGTVAVVTDAGRVRASLELGPSNGSGTRIVPATRIGAVS